MSVTQENTGETRHDSYCAVTSMACNSEAQAHPYTYASQKQNAKRCEDVKTRQKWSTTRCDKSKQEDVFGCTVEL